MYCVKSSLINSDIYKLSGLIGRINSPFKRLLIAYVRPCFRVRNTHRIHTKYTQTTKNIIKRTLADSSASRARLT